jgi:hypothetical protein
MISTLPFPRTRGIQWGKQLHQASENYIMLKRGCAWDILKGLSHEIFTVIFWLEWVYIGLKGNRFWFLNFKDVSSILDSNFKY